MVEGARARPMAGREQPTREEALRQPRLHVATHPLIAVQLTLLRATETAAPRFRELLGELTTLVGYEALADLALAEQPIVTPLEPMIGAKLAQPLAIVPIMRAGLAMVEPLLRLLPDARVWHLGLYRDEESLRPVPYYNRAMRSGQAAHCIVVDPMLATGGSAVSAVELIKGVGAERITFIGIVAAPYGVAQLAAAHPDVEIYVAALDRELNEAGYICPGLGDAGDRVFHTGA
ncbi:MAG TPA: uracil phosphoribosyltransferase [Thermomicrobiales bacterium]